MKKAASPSKPAPDIKPYLRSFYQGNTLPLLGTLLFTVLMPCFNLIYSWLLGEILDITAAGDLERLLHTLFCIAIPAALLSSLLQACNGRLKSRFIHKALTQYKSLAFQKLSGKSISAFSQENTSRYLSALTNDVSTIEVSYLNGSILILGQVFSLVSAFGMMLWYNWKLTAATVAAGFLPLLVSLLMGGELTARQRKVSDQNETFVSVVKDILTGFPVVKSFKAEKEITQLFGDANRETERVKERKRWWALLLNAVSELSSSILQFGIFFLGAYFAIRGDITLGTVVIFVNLCNPIMYPLQVLPQWWAERQAARALIKKLAAAVEENTSRSGEPMEPVLKDSISLQNVTFGYDPEKPVLKDLSLTLNAGKKYALVGASGSGKSTLLNLLMGGYDGYQGSISLDGKELRDIDPDSLYDLMSLMGQNVFLFDDTIRRNITMFRDFPDGQVSSAAQRAGLSPLLEEKGENYVCGENGGNLSGGERQRVSIARCLLRGTPVLLLDEATAALDNQTAFQVVDSLLKLDGLTRLVVTHRLEKGLLEQYDGIFVLRNGQLWETGTFEDLMAQKGYFYSLYNVAGD